MNFLFVVKDQCPECKSTKVATISLTEPLMPEVSRFFAPLNDILTSIKSITIFQSEQINIILQCFYQLVSFIFYIISFDK